MTRPVKQIQSLPLIKPLPLSPRPSDLELVNQSQAGNPSAFSELVRRYETRIYSLAYNMMGSFEEAEDVLQETFLRVYKSLDGFRGEAGFSTWLYRIATNVCLGRLRKKEPQVSASLDELIATEEGEVPRQIEDWSKNPEEVFLSKEFKSVLSQTITDLPEGYREVLVLRDIEDLKTQEVARILHLSIPAVKSRLHRARLFLREKLSRYFSL
ncbi:MAG: sigma-70 family RNA polymerase sigma factor [bacterium]